jgi:hypothetical protein
MGNQKRSARAGAKARLPSIVWTGAAVANASSRCLPLLDGFSTERLLKNYDHYLASDSWCEADLPTVIKPSPTSGNFHFQFTAIKAPCVGQWNRALMAQAVRCEIKRYEQ